MKTARFVDLPPHTVGNSTTLGETTRVGGALALVALVAFFGTAVAPAVAAGPAPEPYGAHDSGGFRNVLPAGQGHNANLSDLAAFEANGTMPTNAQDQLDMYSNLVYATPGLKKSEIPDYYKDATFGTKPGDVVGTENPRNDVTIVRDRFGVPHIYGSTRSGAMFGAGYVAAEDRLFFIDALRHAGRADLSSFAGGSNAGMDESVWADTPYNESELHQQYENADELYGHRGELLQNDVQNYVEGVNQFISEACVDQTRLPGEYSVIDPSQNICLPANQWTVDDVISIASLVAGIFGKGGGGELNNAITLEDARQQFGSAPGSKVFADFESANDPEAPTTVHGGNFHYGQPPKHPRGLALPDPGSVQFADVTQPGGFASSSRPSSSRPHAQSAPDSGTGEFPGLLNPLAGRHDASNALLVSGRESKSGHPVAVMGPQVAYFAPEILMEQDIHAPAGPGSPGIDARGAAFPGTNLYVQLGHGRNYAWSATSAGQDIIDTYAVKLCDPNGGAPTIASDHYEYAGECLPFDVLTRTNSWSPTPADMSGPGSETLTTLRTKLGVVIARATIGGKPYAYTQLRDTYFHEVDPSALGFANFNDPTKMRTPKEFFHSACHISYTFNWFYVNRKHIAYFNSGQNPVRPPGVDPNLPTFGEPKFLWRNYDPTSATEDQTPCGAHPQVIDQRFLTSWNNRQAPNYNVGFSSLFRSQMLDERIRPDIRGRKKIDLQQLISDMEDAGTVDLRGDKVLPWLLRVIETKPVTDPDLKQAISVLASWQASGAHRLDRNKDGTYDDALAVRIMDAWWPRLVRAEFEPAVGQTLFDRLPLGHDAPGDLGSAFDTSSYGIVQKDLRDVLGAHVRGAYSRTYCGGGKLAKCRQALLDSLGDALQHDTDADLYGTDGCKLGVDQHGADPQACHDAVHFRAVGAITQPDIPWINRPTFQQAVEIK
jgi:acyl-homoserine lactone acylase PvdQ